jgi:hypothetical protein
MKRAFLLLLLLAAGARTFGAEHSVRIWTSSDGRTIEASLVQADRTIAILRLKNGHEATVPLERLSESDRRHLEDFRKTGGNLRIGTMPVESKIDTTVTIEGGPKTFTTPNFTFDCEREVTKAFISEAARVFEGTLEAVRSLPLGLDPKPAEGETRFRTQFLDRSTFETEFNREREGEKESSVGNGPAPTLPGRGTANVANVAGVYLPIRREVLVPFTSLGVSMNGSKVTLRKSSDTSTLIHEVTHQVMHDWLVATPLWVGEGLAEYLSMVPYQNGRFEFRNASSGLKETLLEDYRIGDGETVAIHRPHQFIEASNAQWSGVSGDYLSALMVTYFFIHLDQPAKPCASLAAYLNLLKESQAETEAFIGDYNRAVREFEEKRLAYNREVDAYNRALGLFKSEVDAYNRRVDAYNAQVRNGVPVGQRTGVGEEPVEPVPPRELVVPEILRKNEGGSAVDFLGRIKESALPALLRGRDGNALDLAVVETFAAMGIRVVLHDLEKGVGTRPPLPPPGGAAPRVRPSAQPSADLIERL